MISLSLFALFNALRADWCAIFGPCLLTIALFVILLIFQLVCRPSLSKIGQTRSWIKGSRSLYLIFFCLFFCRTFCAISARARKTRDCTPLLYSLYQSQNYNPAKGGHWDKVVMDPWFGSHLSIFSLTFPGPNLIKENVSERFYLPVEYTVRVLLTIFTRKLYNYNNKVETEARRIAGFNFCYHCGSQNCGSYFSFKKKYDNF